MHRPLPVSPGYRPGPWPGQRLATRGHAGPRARNCFGAGGRADWRAAGLRGDLPRQELADGAAEERQRGNIDPLGITGTPVYDAASGHVLLVAEHGGTVRHELYAIALTGTECELVVYPREGHVPVERAHLLDALQRTQAWFDRHLKPGT